MAFGLGKLAVLESKLNIYEDLSKEMLDKLEKAVGTISENSNRIAIILERHENRLDESEKTDDLILKMLEEIKERHEKDTETIHGRITTIQKKLIRMPALLSVQEQSSLPLWQYYKWSHL